MNSVFDFDPNDYSLVYETIGDLSLVYRAYTQVLMIRHPVDSMYQVMNIFVPEAYYEGQQIGRYDAQTAPVLLPITVGGYMPGKPGIPEICPFQQTPNAIAVALSKGYVVAAPGTRGRTLKDTEGRFTGKAPACIIDLKAAVRGLRELGDQVPGNKSRIISNGTSAGGALSALLGSTGDHPDYMAYLEKAGAAQTSDTVFASSCYCPITDLEHADMAYEWLWNGETAYHRMRFEMINGKPNLEPDDGIMSADQINLSAQLRTQFPNYLNSLGLRGIDGIYLSLEPNGNGPFRDMLKSHLVASANEAIGRGQNLDGISWIVFDQGRAVDLDWPGYIRDTTRMKPAPAFDDIDLKSPENDLFGSERTAARHFTAFSQSNSTAGGELAGKALVKLLNPFKYINSSQSVLAKNWRIRHGSIDRDTSLAVPTILATLLQNAGLAVDYKLPWGLGHGGDYDLEELFAWIDARCD